ncbi:MmyB family transcriptional regulator [Kribbella sp. NPDC055110]
MIRCGRFTFNELRAASPEFERFWTSHDVQNRSHCPKILNHPIAGQLTFSLESLQLPATTTSSSSPIPRRTRPPGPGSASVQRVVRRSEPEVLPVGEGSRRLAEALDHG